jgi:threonyl-tRNA synthetase
VGDREQAQGAVAVRHRSGEDLGPLPLSQVIDRLKDEIENRS